MLIFYFYSCEALEGSLPHKRAETNRRVAEYNLYPLQYQSSVETLVPTLDILDVDENKLTLYHVLFISIIF